MPSHPSTTRSMDSLELKNWREDNNFRYGNQLSSIELRDVRRYSTQVPISNGMLGSFFLKLERCFEIDKANEAKSNLGGLCDKCLWVDFIINVLVSHDMLTITKNLAR